MRSCEAFAVMPTPAAATTYGATPTSAPTAARAGAQAATTAAIAERG